MAAQAELDAYALCPCGSGKKLKFCCHDIAPDMLRVLRLVEDGQLKPALQQLESLEKKSGLNPVSEAWVLTTKASVLVNDGRAPDAEPPLRKVLQSSPNNPAALSLLALLRLRSAGPKEAWNLINRVCGQETITVMPPALPTLFLELGSKFLEESQFLAGIHFLELANISTGNSEETSELLLSVLSKADLPYPLRGNYPFHLKDVSESTRKQLAEAELFAKRGAVAKASTLLQKIVTETEPKGSDGASLWFSLGLCRAWSAEIESAIEAFRKSAELEPDFDTAVDTEALAQVLSHYHVEPQLQTWRAELAIGSASRLLTLLDKEPMFTRQPLPPVDPGDPMQPPVAIYSIADRPRLAASEAPTRDNTPRIIGNFAIFDANPEIPNDQPMAAIMVKGKDLFDTTLQSIREFAGSELTGTPQPAVLHSQPAVFATFYDEFLLPPDTNLRGQLAFAKQIWQHLASEAWPQTPLPGLGGKTPQQAATDPALKRQLAAAVVVLEAICESRGYVLEPDLIRSRLGLPAAGTITIGEEAKLSDLSLLELRRLSLMQLTDAQLLTLIRLMSVWRLNGIMHHALIERLSRPGMQTELPKDKACLFLAKIARSRLAPEESLTWLSRGRQEATARKAPLHEQFAIDLQELVERGDADRKDPALPELANQIWTRYALKVAELRPTLVRLLTELELPGPWQMGTSPLQAGHFSPVGEPGGSGLWTPDAAGSAAPAAGGEAGSGGSKLWLPGQ